VDDKGDIVLADKRTAKLGKLITKTATIDELTVTAPNTSVLYSAAGIISGSSLVTITALTGTLTAKVLQGGATAKLYDTGGSPALLFDSGDWIHYVGDEYLFKIGSDTKAKISASGLTVAAILDPASSGINVDGVTLKDGGVSANDLRATGPLSTLTANSIQIDRDGTVGQRILSVGPDGSTYGTLTFDICASDGSPYYSAMRINATGALIVGTDPGGTELLRVGGGGLVGGVVLKDARVTATNGLFADSSAYVFADTAGGIVYFNADANDFIAYARSTNRWGLYIGGAEKVAIDSSGALIVGTDPGGTELLRVGGTARFGGKITTVSAVPASFADLAAVRTWLAAQFA